jgi:hypothetical protein
MSGVMAGELAAPAGLQLDLFGKLLTRDVG